MPAPATVSATEPTQVDGTGAISGRATSADDEQAVADKTAELWAEQCTAKGWLALPMPEKDRAGWEQCARTIIDFRLRVQATAARYAALQPLHHRLCQHTESGGCAAAGRVPFDHGEQVAHG